EDIWHPDLTLTNSFEDYKQVGDDKLLVESWSDGTVYWFPFQLNVTSRGLGVNIDEFERSSSWDVTEVSWETDADAYGPNVIFSITMKRKPLFIIQTIVFPIIACALLNTCVFVLPVESGERSGFAVTMFLALAVFLTIVSTTLPANSDTVAVFSVYLIIQTTASVLITVIANLSIRLSILSDPIPKWLNKGMNRTRLLLTCKTCKKRAPTSEVHPFDAESGDVPKKSVDYEPADAEFRDYTWKD
ncbi:ACHA7-like protein, partial [Mya arenaria]